MADSEYCGKPYRQVTHRLGWHLADGTGRMSERPRQGNKAHGWGAYLDSDEAPTLIVFGAADAVDVAGLLRLGAIVAYTPPRVYKPAGKETR